MHVCAGRDSYGYALHGGGDIRHVGQPGTCCCNTVYVPTELQCITQVKQGADLYHFIRNRKCKVGLKPEIDNFIECHVGLQYGWFNRLTRWSSGFVAKTRTSVFAERKSSAWFIFFVSYFKNYNFLFTLLWGGGGAYWSTFRKVRNTLFWKLRSVVKVQII